MVAEIISIGTEILMGNITNTNAVYFARQCAALGIDCYYQDVVGDNEERMTQMIRTALDRSDLILLSGGLGPTEDDLTKEVVCKVMGEPLVEDPHTKARIQSYMESHLKSNPDSAITANNWKQAPGQRSSRCALKKRWSPASPNRYFAIWCGRQSIISGKGISSRWCCPIRWRPGQRAVFSIRIGC